MATVESCLPAFRPDVVARCRRAAWIGWSEQQPDGGYAPLAYRFEDDGLDAAAERAKFRDYMVRFGIQPEGAPAHAAAGALSGRGVAASAATQTPTG